jgi:hypothetical protein
MRKILAAYLFSLLLILMLFIMTGCGSIKKTVEAKTESHTLVQTDSASAMHVITETKTYGDTLVGVGYIPLKVLKDTTSASDDSLIMFSLGSTGIELRGTMTPVYQHNQLTGLKTDYRAIAKPVTVTNTSKTEQADVRSTIQKDSTKTVQSSSTTKTGLSFPWWCWLLAAGLVVVLLYWLYKSLPFKL